MIELSFKGAKAKEFKTLLEVVQAIVDGPRKWDFYSDKVVMACMENSSSVFVMFEIKKTFFDTYKVDESSLGLSIDDLKKVFSRSIKDSAEIKMSYNNEENRLVIKFEEDRSSVEYKLNVHVPEDEHSEIVSKVRAIPLGTSIKLEGGGNLKNILSDVGIVAQKELKQLAIKVNKTEEISFELKGDTTGINAKSTIRKGDGSPIIEVSTDMDEVTSFYDMDYLEKLFKIDSISEQALMELASDHPLRLTFALGNNNIEFIYLMAPLEVESADDL
jgi:hypothetical protein